MKELIVVTYKLPTDAWTKKMYGDDVDYIYDSTAYHNDALAQVEIKKLKRKYTEVDSFVCSLADYDAFVDNEAAYEEFVRTGVCPLKPIEEDVDVGTSSKTVTIECPVRIQRDTSEATFEYNVDIDDVGQIVFTPYDEGTRFCHEGEDVVEGENVKFDTVKLTAQMISDCDNYDYFMGTDDIGQFVITPDSEDTSFLSASVDDSLNLVTEQYTTDSDELDFTEGDRVVVEFDGKTRSGKIVDFVGSDPMDDATGCNSGDFCAWTVRFDDGSQEMIDPKYMKLEECAESMKVMKESNKYRDFEWDQEELYAVVKNDGRYAGIPCTSYGEAQNMAANHDGSKIFKLVLADDPAEELLEEDFSEVDHTDIVNKVMRGDIPIFSGDGEPTLGMEHIPELDNSQGVVTFEYYYDKESNSVVSYAVPSGV